MAVMRKNQLLVLGYHYGFGIPLRLYLDANTLEISLRKGVWAFDFCTFKMWPVQTIFPGYPRVGEPTQEDKTRSKADSSLYDQTYELCLCWTLAYQYTCMQSRSRTLLYSGTLFENNKKKDKKSSTDGTLTTLYRYVPLKILDT